MTIKKKKSLAWVGLGSNLNNPKQQLLTAFVELAQVANTCLLKTSCLWSTKPLGPQDQPDFINAVALLETSLTPLALLDALQAIEQQHQRQRQRHWGPRTLDLDLLLYDDLQLEHPRLSLPHPEMHRRRFVLEPLMELDSCLQLPKYGRIKTCLIKLQDQDAENSARPLC